MRRALLLLPLLALTSMGSQCEIRARVGEPVRPEEKPPSEPTADGGLVVVVRAGDSLAAADAASAVRRQPVVQAALGASVLAVATSGEAAVGPSAVERESARLLATSWLEPGPASPSGGSAAPVPEPSGLLLFASGLALLFPWLQRRGGPSREEAASSTVAGDARVSKRAATASAEATCASSSRISSIFSRSRSLWSGEEGHS
jgi:hypothetical protein